MSSRMIESWLQLVANRDAASVEPLLAEDVVFHSPVVDTPLAGRDLTHQYLTAAFRLFDNGTFRYVREAVGERDAVLEFVVEVDGVRVNGVDMIRWNDEGLITDFKVMLRPMKAVKLMHLKTAALLQGAS